MLQVWKMTDYSGIKLKFEGIAISSNTEQNTLRVQLYDKNGKLSNNIITINKDCIQSKQKLKSKIISTNNTIINSWLRQVQISMNENVLQLILKFSKYELTVRLTRPLSLGHANNSHHLHIRQIEVYSISNKYCYLSFKDASPCVKRGSAGRTPLKCIDGDKGLTYQNINHNDYTNMNESNSESHWMEFIIDQQQNLVTDVNEIGKILVYNRGDGFKDRIVGCILELYRDGNVVKSWTVQNTQDQYEFFCN